MMMTIFLYPSLLNILFIFLQTSPLQATTLLADSYNPPLQQAANLLHSFQKQTVKGGDCSLPARLTKDLYTAGQIVTGQSGIAFSSHRVATKSEKKLYLTIAFTIGVDLAARWQSISFSDSATYFEKCFGFKEGELQRTHPDVLQSRRPLQHCFLITLAALFGYQSVMMRASPPLTQIQEYYSALQPLVNRAYAWLEPLLDSIQKENDVLYPALSKIYNQKGNHYYLFKDETHEYELEISPKPLHFTHKSGLPLTPWHPTPQDQMKNLIATFSEAAIDDLSHQIRAAGFIITSLEEAQNFLIALWLHKPNETFIKALLQGHDQDLYEAFSEDRHYLATNRFGITLAFNPSSRLLPRDEEKPLLFLQLASEGSNLNDDF